MRVAAIYDIHGNLPALEAVLQDIRQAEVDRVVVGGDVVPGPMPRQAIARLLDLDIPVQFIQGNGDRAVLEQMARTETGSIPEQFREVEIPGLGAVLFCHATPRNDTEIFTRLTPEDRLLPAFAGVNESVVICGHTHMQFDRMIGKIRVVNAGSVGMPYGEAGAFWLLLGPDVHLRHTPYDLAKAASRIRETNYPQAEEFAAGNILQTPLEEEMLERFGQVELR